MTVNATGILLLGAFLLVVFSSLQAAAEKPSPPEVVPYVDLERYIGAWYEIASIPQRFQKDCVGVVARYAMRPDGKISVTNECRKFTLDGKLKTAKGTAWVVDTKTNAKLKVQFFWPFRGDYWILELDEDYEWAVVGSPDRNYLWILCRRPQMDEAIYAELLERVRRKGFDVSRLKKTLQFSSPL